MNMLVRHIATCAISAMVVVGAAAAQAQQRLTNAQITKELQYVVSAPSFTKLAPLSQQELMKLAANLAAWGAFPEKYTGKDHIQGADGYITREMVRQFFHALLGTDLVIWQSNAQNVGDRRASDMLVWTYNSANSMYKRPTIRISTRSDDSPGKVSVRFDVYENGENAVLHLPAVRTGSGAAAIEYIAGNWTITSWKRPVTPKRSNGSIPSAMKRPGLRSKSAIARSVTHDLVSRIRSKDWAGVAALWSGAADRRGEYLSLCKKLGRDHVSDEVQDSAADSPATAVWVILEAKGWSPTIAINTVTSRIVDIVVGED
ncbi:MAG TPA: hypothetical protein VKT77_16280 [Chthonomonadaceae bacterium]|nr:hypothetical protein [Chthonomonadaceae bacterium]